MSSPTKPQLVIVAGGRGTRLKDRMGSMPKAMVDVGGKPLIEHQVLLAHRYGITNILILTGFGAQHIEGYLGNGERWGVDIQYHRETAPRGTAGAVIDAFDNLGTVFFVLYGDIMLNVDLSRIASAHAVQDGATLFVHPNDHPCDSDLIELDERRRVLAIHPYPHPPESFFSNLVNAGLYIFSKKALEPAVQSKNTFSYPLDFGKDVFPFLLSQGVQIRGYWSREYIKDAGTPERLDSVRHDYVIGRIQRGSLETPISAVLLDRDGTLNSNPGWVRAPEQLVMLPGAAEAVRFINHSGRLAVLVTNQPVVARGDCSEHELRLIHNKLEWLLGKSHAYLDRIYWCPHHPDKGFPGERAELKTACTCRKPSTGLVELAVRDLNIDLEQSWMVGDSSADMELAANLGIKSALVRSNQREFARVSNCKPTASFDTVLDAVQFITAGKSDRL